MTKKRRMTIKISAEDFEDLEKAVEEIMELYPDSFSSDPTQNLRPPFVDGWRCFINIKIGE